MPLIEVADTARSISLGEYVSYVRREVDLRDETSVINSAWALRALANDRNFVLAALAVHLRTLLRSNRARGGASITLFDAPDFYVRMNLWVPEKPRLDAVSFYSYELPHDHNFTFLTVGYYGPGYSTALFEYDYDRLSGFKGEASYARRVGEATLDPGSVMIFRAGRDIHIQYPPSQPSISLNLMIKPRPGHETQQYIFDRSAQTILAGSGDAVSRRLTHLSKARCFRDDRTKAHLNKILDSHPCVRTRGFALRLLLELYGPFSVEASEIAHEVTGAIEYRAGPDGRLRCSSLKSLPKSTIKHIFDNR